MPHGEPIDALPYDHDPFLTQTTLDDAFDAIYERCTPAGGGVWIMPLLLPHGLPSLPAVFLALLVQCSLALLDVFCSSAVFQGAVRSIGF